MNFGDLTQRLYDRYAPVEPMAAGMADMVENEPWIALAGLVKIGIDRGDLRVDESEAALRMARSGTFRELAQSLVEQLQEYLRSSTAV